MVKSEPAVDRLIDLVGAFVNLQRLVLGPNGQLDDTTVVELAPIFATMPNLESLALPSAVEDDYGSDPELDHRVTAEEFEHMAQSVLAECPRLKDLFLCPPGDHFQPVKDDEGELVAVMRRPGLESHLHPSMESAGHYLPNVNTRSLELQVTSRSVYITVPQSPDDARVPDEEPQNHTRLSSA